MIAKRDKINRRLCLKRRGLKIAYAVNAWNIILLSW